MELFADGVPFVSEYAVRNAKIASSNEAVFLRRFRNYLVHVGMAPVLQTLSLDPSLDSSWTGHHIRLSARGLLEWTGWNEQTRTFLSEFDDGPILGELVGNYGNQMFEFYQWLFSQRASSVGFANAPAKFRGE